MTLKPGTRCECRETDHAHRAHHLDGYTSNQTGPCGRDAVRLVTVQRQKRDYERESTTPADSPVFFDVPMCEPCAAFHEKGGQS
jgi:hypothetical protein